MNFPIKLTEECKLNKNSNIIPLNIKHSLNKLNINDSINNTNQNFNSIICSKCFRMVYIYFNFIKDYITTDCKYCNTICVYNYDSFLEKIKENNILYNSSCIKCNKYFDFKQNENKFYLVEENKANFIVICKKCLENNKSNFINVTNKIINFDDLFLKENGLVKNNHYNINAYKLSNSDEKNAEVKINSFREYEKRIFLIKSIIKNTPNSMQNKANQILKKILTLIKITNIIIQNYQNFHNFTNYLNTVYSILIFNEEYLFSLNINKNISINASYEIVNDLIKNEQNLLIGQDLEFTNALYPNYYFMTKNYKNKEQYILDNNEPKNQTFSKFFSGILNVNFETGETINYAINSSCCFSEKISPIYYNYNNTICNSINYQEILLYNFKQDHKLYYAVYDINKAKLENKSIIQLLDYPIKNMYNVIILNYTQDLFLIAEQFNGSMISCIYISNFRTNKRDEAYIFKLDDFKDYDIIYRESDIFIRTKENLYLFNSLFKKEKKIPKGSKNEINPNRIISSQLINKSNSVMLRNKCIEIINKMEFGISEINKIIMNYRNKNIKLDEINNYLGNSKVKDIIFNSKRYSIYYLYRKMIYLNKDYFLLITSKHVNLGIIKSFFYLSLYNYNLEEISTIEIDKFLSNEDTFKINISLIENLLITVTIKPNENSDNIYEYEFKNQELLFIQKINF